MPTKTFSIKQFFRSNFKMGERGNRALPLMLLVVVCVFIVYPIVMLVMTSFDQGGRFGFDAYVEVFTSASTYKALVNTLRMEGMILVGAWTIGGSLAFLRHKTDFHYKKLIDTLVFLSFTIPAYILSISWVQLFAFNGYVNRILRALWPDFRYGFDAYTIEASAMILMVHVYPLVYFGVSNTLKLLGNSFEQSARMCGAGRRRIVFRVILPLVVPAFVSTGLLVVSRTMANFGVPAQLATPRGKEVLTTRVYSEMADLDLAVVAVLSLLLVGVSLGLFFFSEKVLKKHRYSNEVPGRLTDEAVIRLGKWQKPILGMVGIFFVVSLVVPFLSILFSSLIKHWGIPYTLENLTLQNYVKLFFEEKVLSQPLMNSLMFGLIAATVAALIASLLVYFYDAKGDWLSRLTMHLAQLPIAIPNIILAIAAIFAWINDPFKLYGTRAIIIVTYVVLFIPICIKQMLGASKKIDRSMDQAAQMMGVRPFKRYTHIFLPQIRQSLLSGFLICFLISLKEIPISLLLFSAGTKTMGVMLFTIQSNAYGLEMTSAVALVVIAVSAIGNFILNKIGARGYK